MQTQAAQTCPVSGDSVPVQVWSPRLTLCSRTVNAAGLEPVRLGSSTLPREILRYIMDKEELLKKLYEGQKQRRINQAKLPIEEKIKILIKLQKIRYDIKGGQKPWEITVN